MNPSDCATATFCPPPAAAPLGVIEEVHGPVVDSGGPLQVPVTPDCLDRLLNTFGQPPDGGPPLVTDTLRPIVAPPAPLTAPHRPGARAQSVPEIEFDQRIAW